MRVSRVRLLLLIVGLSGLIFVALQSTSGERKASASGGESLLDHLRTGRVRPTLEVAPGTHLHIRLKDRITDRNRAGDIFLGRLDGDVEQGGQVLVPRGTRVVGRITRLGEDTKRSSSTQVSLVLEQFVVGKQVVRVDSLALTLSMPAGVPAPSSSSLLLQTPGIFPERQEGLTSGPGKRAETIYQPDTRLTFVLAERLRLPVFVARD